MERSGGNEREKERVRERERERERKERKKRRRRSFFPSGLRFPLSFLRFFVKYKQSIRKRREDFDALRGGGERGGEGSVCLFLLSFSSSSCAPTSAPGSLGQGGQNVEKHHEVDRDYGGPAGEHKASRVVQRGAAEERGDECCFFFLFTKEKRGEKREKRERERETERCLKSRPPPPKTNLSHRRASLRERQSRPGTGAGPAPRRRGRAWRRRPGPEEKKKRKRRSRSESEFEEALRKEKTPSFLLLVLNLLFFVFCVDRRSLRARGRFEDECESLSLLAKRREK